MNERNMLLNQIQKYCFSLHELVLYLDTHPNCVRALSFYNKYKQLKLEAEAEFNRKFGPLTAQDNQSTQTWHWTSEPWPWERS